jgi:hypothetical protein
MKKKLGKHFGISNSFYNSHSKNCRSLSFTHTKKNAFTYVVLCVNNWQLQQLRRSQDSRNMRVITVLRSNDTPAAVTTVSLFGFQKKATYLS